MDVEGGDEVDPCHLVDDPHQPDGGSVRLDGGEGKIVPAKTADKTHLSPLPLKYSGNYSEIAL